MKPTEILRHEHQIILMVLEVAEREARIMRDKWVIHMDKLNKILDFFRNFVERCHHKKEEKYLFARMNEHGIPKETGPIAVMLYEHDQSRNRIKVITNALHHVQYDNSAAFRAVHDNLEDYVELLRAHIDKENEVVFCMADEMFTNEEQDYIRNAFERLEIEELGEGVHERYHSLAHELSYYHSTFEGRDSEDREQL